MGQSSKGLQWKVSHSLSPSHPLPLLRSNQCEVLVYISRADLWFYIKNQRYIPLSVKKMQILASAQFLHLVLFCFEDYSLSLYKELLYFVNSCTVSHCKNVQYFLLWWTLKLFLVFSYYNLYCNKWPYTYIILPCC